MNSRYLDKTHRHSDGTNFEEQTMREILTFVALLLSLSALVFSGCRGDNKSGLITSSTTTNLVTVQETPAVITTSEEGASAASAVLQAKELVVTSTNIFRDLGFIAQSQMVSTTTSTGTGTCADYGTYDYSSTYSNGKYSISFSFDLCRQNGFQYDGTYTVSGNPDQLTGKMYGMKILNFHNNYTTLIGSIIGISLSYTMQGSGIASTATYTFNAKGGLQAFDYYSLGQHTMNFSNLETKYNIQTDTSTNTETSSFTANGIYSVKSSTNKTVKLTYSDFRIDQQKQLSTDTIDVSMAGRVAVDYTPDSDFEGVFDVSTSTPIRSLETPYPPKTTQGTFIINNAATAQYGASDTITVAASGDSALNYSKEFTLMKLADFYALEQQLPIVVGQSGAASGNIMSISALSTGATSTDLNCYTDVHVNYYTQTSPTVSDTILWYVDWHQDLSSCTADPNIPYQQGTSSTGVAGDPCDVGLDINGASTDITSGGVEHFLAANVPSGYYVLSINNYSCATTVTNDATMLVGDYLFGPYNCTYSSSDSEGGHDPGAWCRLADMRVNTDGTIDVISPDVLLDPWHP
jgi:hypothetical protein